MNLETLIIAAKVENLNRIIEFIEQRVASAGMSEARSTRVLIALEEAFVNVCRYAYPGGEGEARLSCSVEGGTFVIELADFGQPFDLLSLPDPDLGANLEQRKVGGLGIFCLRNLADEVSTRREGKRNILRMVFALA